MIEESRNQLRQAEIIQAIGKEETEVIPHPEENHPRQDIQLREAATADHLQDHREAVAADHLLQEVAEVAATAQATGEDRHESA